MTGTIPTQLGQLTNLVRLTLLGNNLTGSIPVALGSLTSLQFCNLHDNQLTGAIPTQLGQLAELTHLRLDNNQLTGEIPAELGNLTNLRYLYLHDNQLTGEIPTELGGLTNLQWLELHTNELAGAIPDLSGLTSLYTLYLHDNQLSGPIHNSLVTLSNNQLLRLSLYGNPGLYGYPPACTAICACSPPATATRYACPARRGAATAPSRPWWISCRVTSSPTQLVFTCAPNPTPTVATYSASYYPPPHPAPGPPCRSPARPLTLPGLTPGATSSFWCGRPTAAPPSRSHHFTLAIRWTAWSRPAKRTPISVYGAPAGAVLPCPAPTTATGFSTGAVNGPYTLYMTAGGGNKLPYGKPPALILAWLCTEAVRTQRRVLVLGASLSKFMRTLGINSTSGGVRGEQTRLRNHHEAALWLHRSTNMKHERRNDHSGGGCNPRYPGTLNHCPRILSTACLSCGRTLLVLLAVLSAALRPIFAPSRTRSTAITGASALSSSSRPSQTARRASTRKGGTYGEAIRARDLEALQNRQHSFDRCCGRAWSARTRRRTLTTPVLSKRPFMHSRSKARSRRRCTPSLTSCTRTETPISCAVP